MNNKQLITELSRRLNRDEKDVSILLNGFTNLLKETFSNLDSIAIPGFGELGALKEEEKISVDAISGKRKLYPPSIEVKFKNSSLLKKKLLE